MGMEACREERRLKMPPSLCYYFGNSRQRERWCRRMDAERVGWGGGGGVLGCPPTSPSGCGRARRVIVATLGCSDGCGYVCIICGVLLTSFWHCDGIL